jgi:hypothetical protein
MKHKTRAKTNGREKSGLVKIPADVQTGKVRSMTMHEKRPRRRLYWAYGSNLDVKAMRYRCPDARKFRRLYATQCELVFRGVADVEIVDDKSIVTPGGLWWISERDESALDSYEGVASGFYEKLYFDMVIDGRPQEIMFYKMKRHQGGIVPPSASYFGTIRQGYKDFGLSVDALFGALERSHDRKTWTQELRDRWHRKGKQPLMQVLR